MLGLGSYVEGRFDVCTYDVRIPSFIDSWYMITNFFVRKRNLRVSRRSGAAGSNLLARKSNVGQVQ